MNNTHTPNAYTNIASDYIMRHDTPARNASHALTRHIIADTILDPACTPASRVQIRLVCDANVCDAMYVHVFALRVHDGYTWDTEFMCVTTNERDDDAYIVYNDAHAHPVAHAMMHHATDWDFGI